LRISAMARTPVIGRASSRSPRLSACHMPPVGQGQPNWPHGRSLWLLYDERFDTISRVGDVSPDTSREPEKPRHSPCRGFASIQGQSCRAVNSAREALADFTERASGDHRSRRKVGHCCFHKCRTDRQDCP
jgi:hypothetical protein